MLRHGSTRQSPCGAPPPPLPAVACPISSAEQQDCYLAPEQYSDSAEQYTEQVHLPLKWCSVCVCGWVRQSMVPSNTKPMQILHAPALKTQLSSGRVRSWNGHVLDAVEMGCGSLWLLLWRRQQCHIGIWEATICGRLALHTTVSLLFSTNSPVVVLYLLNCCM